MRMLHPSRTARSRRATPSFAKLTWYVTDVADFHASVEQLFPIWAKVIGAHLPAMTLVEVGALVAPEAKIEIDAIAVVPPERS